MVTYTHFIVGCADLGAPHLTIGTRIIVGATIGRPQRDRSLRKERPRTRLIITWAADDRPYGINIAGEFTFGGVRAPRPTEMVYRCVNS